MLAGFAAFAPRKGRKVDLARGFICGEIMRLVALVLLVACSVSCAQQYTRGIGVYPGDPKEYMGPTLRVDRPIETWRCTGRHISRAHTTII